MTTKLTRGEREKLLSKIDGLVRTKFYDPTFDGKNWNQIVARHREAILGADFSKIFVAAMEANKGSPNMQKKKRRVGAFVARNSSPQYLGTP